MTISRFPSSCVTFEFGMTFPLIALRIVLTFVRLSGLIHCNESFELLISATEPHIDKDAG